jgi:hypothetical protein
MVAYFLEQSKYSHRRIVGCIYQKVRSMKLHEIRRSDAARTILPSSHPILLKLAIDPVDWQRFNRLLEDDPGTRIMGHDEPSGGLMTVQIACASAAVRDALSDAW